MFVSDVSIEPKETTEKRKLDCLLWVQNHFFLFFIVKNANGNDFNVPAFPLSIDQSARQLYLLCVICIYVLKY
jgi:hypothetical protein